MSQTDLDALLERFNGGPGITEGLSHEETMAMLQALIDNGQVYNDPGLCAFADAFTDAFTELGLTGYDKSKAPAGTY